MSVRSPAEGGASCGSAAPAGCFSLTGGGTLEGSPPWGTDKADTCRSSESTAKRQIRKTNRTTVQRA